MPDKVTLYGFSASTYCRTTRLVCEESGIEYDFKPLEFRSESHRLLHPFLRMPVLQHGTKHIYESLAICTYLDTVVSTTPGSLQPDSPHAKVTVLQWVSAYMDYFPDILLHGKPEKSTDTWPEKTQEYLAILNAALAEQDYLAGPAVSFADLFLAPAIDYALQVASFENLLAQQTHLLRWWQSMSQRPSFIKTQH